MRGESGTVLERKMKIPMTTTETLSKGKGRICEVGIEVRRAESNWLGNKEDVMLPG